MWSACKVANTHWSMIGSQNLTGDESNLGVWQIQVSSWFNLTAWSFEVCSKVWREDLCCDIFSKHLPRYNCSSTMFADDEWYVSTSATSLPTVLLSSLWYIGPPLYARWLDMSHDAIFVHPANICPIFEHTAVFATHLYVHRSNLQPIWPLIKIKHYPLGC